MAPIVSIVIPCYNQAVFLPETLESVLNQDFSDWECIIVNDGSADNTEGVALDWVAQDERFKYFHKKNEGVSEARNYGIKLAQGKYILPLDGDDKIDVRYLSEALDVLFKNQNVKLVYANTLEFGARNRRYVYPSYSFEQMLTENLIPCTALFRKSDFLKTQGYNVNMRKGLEDWDFWLSFLSSSDLVYKLDGFYLFYRVKDVSRSTLINKESNESLLLQLFKNHIELYLQYFNPIRDHINSAYFEDLVLQLKKSSEYKIGSLICCPYRIMKKIIYRIFK